MRNVLLAMFALWPAVAPAQPEPEKIDGKQVFAITLSPMAAPKPLSHYYLTPQYKEQQPGDQLSGFMKCFMEQALFFSAENEAKRQKLLDIPLNEYPDAKGNAEALAGIAYPRKSTGLGGNIDLAARYTRTEWNEYFLFRKDGINTLLPEIQSLRRLALVLHVRLRAEIKRGEYDRALVTIKSLTGLAKMLESHPTTIGNLVGIAIQTMAWNGVEEMVAQPGCPNLFWSLVELPNPPFSLARGLEGERSFVMAELDYLLTLERPITVQEESKCVAFMQSLLNMDAPGADGDKYRKEVQAKLTRFVADKARVAAARGRLVSVGKMKLEAVSGFSPMQVTLTDDVLSYRIMLDEMRKYHNLPFELAVAGIEEEEKLLRAAKPETIVAPVLLPGMKGVKSAEARNAQRVALLRVLEALRLHAAASNGELPATLADTKLPMPLDPATGKAFEYSVEDGVATLSGGKIAEQPRRVYEVRLRK